MFYLYTALVGMEFKTFTSHTNPIGSNYKSCEEFLSFVENHAKSKAKELWSGEDTILIKISISEFTVTSVGDLYHVRSMSINKVYTKEDLGVTHG